MSDKRVVLITGSSSGIGFASALAYAKAGFHVVATMRNLGKAEALVQAAQEAGVASNIVTRQLEVTDDSSVSKCVAETLENEGQIDVLLCAAGAELPASLDELSIDDGKRMMDVNYWGVIRVFQAVYPHMKQRKSGHVQIVSSWAGRFSNFSFFASYNPTKHALEAAFEGFYGLAKLDGVTISMIEPGPVQTDIHGQFIQDQEKYIKSEERKKNFESLLYGFFLSGVTKITQSRESVAKVIVENAQKSQPEFRVPTSEPVRFNISLFDPDTTGMARVAKAEIGPSLVIPEEVQNSEDFINFKKGLWRSDFSTWEEDSQKWIEGKKEEIEKNKKAAEEGK